MKERGGEREGGGGGEEEGQREISCGERDESVALTAANASS